MRRPRSSKVAAPRRKMTTKTLLAEFPGREVAVVQNPLQLIATAIARGDMKPEVMAQMLDLQHKFREQEREQERYDALKAFNRAIASAKAELPVIRKTNKASFPHRTGGGRTEYWYEDMATIAAQIDPILGKHGLSYRFLLDNEKLNEPIKVTCVLSHELGHCERNTLSGPRDESGSKNIHQQTGSAITYLQRYTLKAALGLAAARDTDAIMPAATISEQQATAISKGLERAGLTEQRFLAKFDIESILDLPEDRYEEALEAIEAYEAEKAKLRSAQVSNEQSAAANA